ncbi:hypothetical protein BGP75_23860 [Motiliproteus sp. MSK22-1]|nr:hypothetical protein BGP75_23860 [Motiliproteus sp. MSK22-1]
MLKCLVEVPISSVNNNKRTVLGMVADLSVRLVSPYDERRMLFVSSDLFDRALSKPEGEL